jgi:hypothetical protein
VQFIENAYVSLAWCVKIRRSSTDEHESRPSEPVPFVLSTFFALSWLYYTPGFGVDVRFAGTLRSLIPGALFEPSNSAGRSPLTQIGNGMWRI